MDTVTLVENSAPSLRKSRRCASKIAVGTKGRIIASRMLCGDPEPQVLVKFVGYGTPRSLPWSSVQRQGAE